MQNLKNLEKSATSEIKKISCETFKTLKETLRGLISPSLQHPASLSLLEAAPLHFLLEAWTINWSVIGKPLNLIFLGADLPPGGNDIIDEVGDPYGDH